jgi:GntR family transcriptional regulator/MocR family aminotransferase
MTLPIPLDRKSPSSLQEQIYNYIRGQILSGAYPAGMRLCSTRELADSLKVSRNTVVLAYEWLASEGYLDTQVGYGTFVRDVLAEKLVTPRETEQAQHTPTSTAPERSHPAIVIPHELPDFFERIFTRPPVDFWYGRVDARQFPAKIWRRLLAEHVLDVPTRLVEYTTPSGAAELREAIAQHLSTAKGIVANPEQIVITAGAQEAMNIVARLFVDHGTLVGVENPGYTSAVTLFLSYRATLRPLTVDDQGVSAEAILREQPKLIYTTPSHQFPTGVIMSPDRRRDVLTAAESVGAYIIEDDYDGEIIYDRPPIAALAALDQSGRVLYIGSFSKSLGAGLRLGFLVAPPALVQAVHSMKVLLSYGQPWLEQVVLASYIRSGSFAAHLRRVRVIYRERRDALIAGLRRCFGDGITITGSEAGLHVICTLPENGPDAREITQLARSVGLGFYTPADAGAYEFGPPPDVERRLLLGYANLTPVEISRAFDTLAAALGR